MVKKHSTDTGRADRRRSIMVAVTNDLVTDQRVHRTCCALLEAGYEVTLVGRLLKDSAAVGRDYVTARMRLLFTKGPLFYAEYNCRLLLKMLFARCDAFYANDTDTLPAAWTAARIRRKPIIFDAHEMFPEVPELVGRERVKAVWSGFEDRILPKLAHWRHGAAAMTVCQSIADIYKERYGLQMAVVRNVPMRATTAADGAKEWSQTLPEGKRILLYQGAVNVGRGIEWMMDAMPLLPECHMVVAGVGDIYDMLREDCRRKGLESCVTFLGRVEPEALHGLTRHATLGLSLLENRGLNYYYSLPNRIADFVQAGVPVVATDFPEIRRVVERYGIGTLIAPAPFDEKTLVSVAPEPEMLARVVKETIDYWDSLSTEERNRRFSAASADLCWDNDKKVLVETVKSIKSLRV